MRLLGVDFGGRRIGLAVVDSETRLPRPIGAVTASGTLAKDAVAIKAEADKETATAVVLGLPLDLDGETAMSRVCRQLGTHLEGLGLPVTFVDESMTSQAAESAMKDAGMKASQSRKRVDAEAACRILERYLEVHAP